jgi:hypothetical protein
MHLHAIRELAEKLLEMKIATTRELRRSQRCMPVNLQTIIYRGYTFISFSSSKLGVVTVRNPHSGKFATEEFVRQKPVTICHTKLGNR